MDESLEGLSPAEKRELLSRLLKQKAAGQIEGTREPITLPEEFPMSAGQQGLWYAFRRDPDATVYNVYLPIRYKSEIDLSAMQRTVAELVRRHPALRTVFAESESTRQPVQRVQSSLAPEFRIVDRPGADDDAIEKLVLDEIARPFDLTRGPFLRVLAIRIAPDDVVVIATTHHIVVDFWSLVLIMDEIREMYPAMARGKVHSLASPPSNYDQFVRQQSDLIASDRGKQMSSYWAQQLSGVPSMIQWVTDFERPRKFTNRARTLPMVFSAGTGAKVAQLARRLKVTPNAVLIAMLQVLIGRFSRQDSFSIGMPFSGRSQREFEKTVGFFVNLLPITADLATNPPFEDLVRIVGETMVDALANESFPFSEMVRENVSARDPSRHPLFQILCTIEKSHLRSERGRASFLLGDRQVFDDFAGMRQESFRAGRTTCEHDVEFVFEFDQDELRGMIIYCRDLFVADTIRSMAMQLTSLADRLLDQPIALVKSIPWNLKDSSAGLSTVSSTVSSGKDSDVILADMLEDTDQPIVSSARRFACYLIRSGVTRGAIVPISMPRGQQAWIAILGVMLSGGVPVPIDSDQPSVTSHVLAGDAEIRFVVADQHDCWARELGVTILSVDPMLEEEEQRLPKPSPDDLAYVIFTSGSTGKPKGVKIHHRGLGNMMRWRRKTTALTVADRVLVLLSHQFDAAFTVVVNSLVQDATPIWPRETGHLDIDALIEQIVCDQITILTAGPSLLRALVAHPGFARCTSIRQVWSGGESMPSDLPQLIRSKLNCQIWNFYGPTEVSIEATACEVTHHQPEQRVPIGKEIDGIRIHMVDDQLAPQPIGVPGQIVISGVGLAVGYLNRPQMTNQAFVTSKYLRDSTGEPIRVYLSGDHGRRRGDGLIEFLGRMDHQVKVRGFRIELEEIERVIESHRCVRRAAVKVIGAGTAGEQLAAYVAADSAFQVQSLQRDLCKQLPAFKRPVSITVLDELPVGTSGKVLRDQLPMPTVEGPVGGGVVEPGSDLERFLVERLSATLGQETIGVDDNFFEAGGTSLQAAILTSDLSGELGVSIPASMMFDLGDVKSIARRLSELHQPQLRDRFGDDSIQLALQSGSMPSEESLLVQWKPAGTQPPIFMVHPPGGIVLCYRELASHLSDAQPLIAIRARGLYGDEPLPQTLAEMAADYVRAIRSRNPSGPYWIGGWSLGGVVAFEVARQLVVDGSEVSGLILLDSTLPERSDSGGETAGLEYGIDLSLSQLSELSGEDQLPYLYRHAEQLGVLDSQAPAEVVKKVIEDLRILFAHHVDLCQAYELEAVNVPVLLVRPSKVPGQADARPDRGWGQWTGKVTVGHVAGHHHSMVQGQGAIEIAQQLQSFVSR